MLEEEREKEKSKFVDHQQIVKIWFDKHKAKDKSFEVGDLVLKWDRANEPKGKHSNFQNLWLRPFRVSKKIGAGMYQLQNLRGEPDTLPMNGQSLKQYFCEKNVFFMFLLEYILIRIKVQVQDRLIIDSFLFLSFLLLGIFPVIKLCSVKHWSTLINMVQQTMLLTYTYVQHKKRWAITNFFKPIYFLSLQNKQPW